MQEPLPVKFNEEHPPGTGASIFSLIVTAIVFFLLGAFMTYIVQGSSDDDARPASNTDIAQAVEATFVALTPTATPLPTRVPTDQTLDDHNPFLGEEDAPVALVEFSDYLCPYCARFHNETLEPLLEHYDGLLKFVYREYPIIGGQLSADISAAAQCAALQDKYWEYTDLIWANPQRQQITSDILAEYAQTVELNVENFNACIEDGTGFDNVVVDFEAGRAFNISATPGFFINGDRFTVGAAPIEVFMDAIDAELERIGITPPARS